MNELSSQASQAKFAANEPTIEEIGLWDEEKLLQWIQWKLPIPLKNKDAEKFLNAEIDGQVFSKHVGDRDFFISAGFSIGVSDKLAELAKETIGRKSKYFLLYHGRHTDNELTVSQGRASSKLYSH